ncbi:uncharacterized protein [Onthophagus taurus]|uniref:uncharacterized protein n=1 Tax=Onthophagus taurus TaxID=166361 RepID=UPI0039BE87E0
MEIEITDTIQNIIDEIVDRENFKSPPEILVSQGSQEGDGYCSKTYAISINDNGDNKKSINLFVKCFPEFQNAGWKSMMEIGFKSEYNFYHEVWPVFMKFQDAKNLKEPFNNVAKSYSFQSGSVIKPIVLENLRSLGYTLRDRKKPVDDVHLRLPIQAFARYHAISYAFKDQEPENFKKLTSSMPDVFSDNFEMIGMDGIIRKSVKQVIEGLDPVLDEKILQRCEGLDDKIIKFVANLDKMVDEYSVIGQGDCWSNNMMFLYNEKGIPIDVKLVDWQAQRLSSPLLDFCYFFYTLATKSELDNAETYINLYYNTLSERITELGSDPKKLFPYEIFREQWKKFSLFGIMTGLLVIKAQLFDKDEIPNLTGHDNIDTFTVVLKNQDKFVNRMKDIIQYFIDNDLL